MKVAIIESIFILLLFLVSFVLGLTRKNASVNQIGRIFPDTSRTLKALCCILIIIEHYALRVDEGVFGKIMIIGGGEISHCRYSCFCPPMVSLSPNITKI